MTSEKPAEAPGGVAQAYFRADAASRQVVLQVGLGVVSFIVGSILSVGASARIGERVGFIENDVVALALRWILERLWLFTVLPAFGYAIGRFTEAKPSRFALVAGLSGETFSVLLVSAINGFEVFTEDVPGLIARVVTLFLGLVVTAWAVQTGRDVSAESQVEANAIAEQKKAEYAAFLAAAEGKGGAPETVESAPKSEVETAAKPEAETAPETIHPHPDPLPKGEGALAPNAEGEKKSGPGTG